MKKKASKKAKTKVNLTEESKQQLQVLAIQETARKMGVADFVMVFKSGDKVVTSTQGSPLDILGMLEYAKHHTLRNVPISSLD